MSITRRMLELKKSVEEHSTVGMSQGRCVRKSHFKELIPGPHRFTSMEVVLLFLYMIEQQNCKPREVPGDSLSMLGAEQRISSTLEKQCSFLLRVSEIHVFQWANPNHWLNVNPSLCSFFDFQPRPVSQSDFSNALVTFYCRVAYSINKLKLHYVLHIAPCAGSQEWQALLLQQSMGDGRYSTSCAPPEWKCDWCRKGWIWCLLADEEL